MNSRYLIDLLIDWWADLQEVVDHLQIVKQLLNRTSQYEEILMIIDAVELSDFPKLKEFIALLNSAQLLNESWKNTLLRECMNRSEDLIIHTSNPEFVALAQAKDVVWNNTIGLDARQWQRIYKRSLHGDIDKLLN